MKKLLSATRQQIISILRGGQKTVNELVAEIGLTDNAIRSHLEGLERQGLVCRGDPRPGTRKPHHTYKLTPEAERILFEGCEPLLKDLVTVLSSKLAERELKIILAETGRKLGRDHSLPEKVSKAARIEHAMGFLAKLGGEPALDQKGDKKIIKSAHCPWAVITSKHPEVCKVAEAMLSELLGLAVKEHCARGAVPSCYFHLANERARKAGPRA
jgi:DeoR family suf operon transcriptional repressor